MPEVTGTKKWVSGEIVVAVDVIDVGDCEVNRQCGKFLAATALLGAVAPSLSRKSVIGPRTFCACSDESEVKRTSQLQQVLFLSWKSEWQAREYTQKSFVPDIHVQDVNLTHHYLQGRAVRAQ